MTDPRLRSARGDWQTPRPLADLVVRAVARVLPAPPATILEPTCGTGNLLAAAADAFPRAALRGHDIDPEHLKIARAAVPRATLHAADFFTTDWDAILAAAPGPLLLLGNPPWVTSAGLGKLESNNAPTKTNTRGLRGLDARTGRSNFDISEWILQRLLAAAAARPTALAFLCKTAVARALITHCHARAVPVAPLGLWPIDTKSHFDAAVDAVLFACSLNLAPPADQWPVYPHLTATTPDHYLAVLDGLIIKDLAAYQRTRSLAGACTPEWRSGIKHDCAAVFEDPPDLEPACIYPLLKSSDLANARAPHRTLLVPQRRLGDDTQLLKTTAPRTWAHLDGHAVRLAARKSSIYRGQPPFAVFGVGDYTFAPWKVAISGFYKRLEFSLVGPVDGRPVVFDDTCYFLPFAAEAPARRAWLALQSPLARDFLASRVFWAAKRPIHKALLQSLDLDALQRALAAGRSRSPPRRSPDAGPLQ